MFRRLSRLLVLLAAAQMLGGHWAALQSIAWVSMVADYSRDSSLVVAIEKTFDGRHPCEICKEVASGRAKEQKQSLTTNPLKFEAVIAATLTVPSPHGLDFVYMALGEAAPALLAEPLTPPPRFA